MSYAIVHPKTFEPLHFPYTIVFMPMTWREYFNVRDWCYANIGKDLEEWTQSGGAGFHQIQKNWHFVKEADAIMFALRWK